MRLVFRVQGSQPEPYVVEFHRIADHLRATCTCAAGTAEQACKHRLDLLAGDHSALVSPELEEFLKLPAVFGGSRLERAMGELADAEAEVAAAKKRLAQVKRMLSRIMHEPHPPI